MLRSENAGLLHPQNAPFNVGRPPPWANRAMKNDTAPMETLTSYDLMELAETVMRGKAFSDATADLDGAWELRALTHAEWLAARNQGVGELPAVSPNVWRTHRPRTIAAP